MSSIFISFPIFFGLCPIKICQCSGMTDSSCSNSSGDGGFGGSGSDNGSGSESVPK